MGSFFLLDKPAADELQRSAGFGEIDEFTGIYQRRAADSYVYLLCSVLVEIADVVAKLGAADYGIVTENRTVVMENGSVGNQFHFSNQVASVLTGRSETAWPCRSVLHVSVAEWYAFPIGITYGHTSA